MIDYQTSILGLYDRLFIVSISRKALLLHHIFDYIYFMKLKANNTSRKTIAYTGLALIAFAANSVLCRMALGEETIDASSFTSLRLLSGVIVLILILSFKKNKTLPKTKGSWYAGFMLFLYAITFSFAYNSLETGTGALILFGAVQITIILMSLLSGNKLHITEWLGVGIAFIGFVYLILPGVDTPSTRGFLLMTTSGIAWGIYTLKGRNSENPLADTTYNFIRTLPFIGAFLLITVKNATYSSEGIWLAIISGGITSGIGYTIWYTALRGLTNTQSAVVQLLVPVIAAFGGVLFIAEKFTFRLTISSLLILGGILFVVLGKKKFTQVITKK